MASKLKPQGSADFEDLQETVRWSRIYAQNRSLPVLVYLAAYGGFFALIFGLAVGGRMAAKAGHPALAVLAAIGLFVAYGAMMVLLFSKHGRRWVDEQYQRLYVREGSVKIESKRRQHYQWLGYVVGALFGICVASEILLGERGYLPLSLFQPVSALYCVPFMVFLWWWQRPASTWVMLLWPALYAAHALLLVSGLPIPKDNMWAWIHMMGAICCYGMIAALLSHAYSRYALRRLQHAAHGKTTTAKGEQQP